MQSSLPNLTAENVTIEYYATAKAIYEAVVAGTNPENIGFEDVTLTYNAGTDVIKNWKPLDTADWSNTFSKFGPGEWTIRIAWDGNKEYKGTSVEVKVTTEDNLLTYLQMGAGEQKV